MWTAILVPAGIIALIAGSVIAGLSIMKHEYGDRLEVLKSASDNPEKALVVYQPSLTSASWDVAHAIAKGLNDGGYEVTLNTPGQHLSPDISGYSVVVFGSPNYGGSPGLPLLDYMKQIRDFSGKRVLLFSTAGSAEGRLEFDKLEALLHGAKPYEIIKLAASETEKNKETASKAHGSLTGLGGAFPRWLFYPPELSALPYCCRTALRSFGSAFCGPPALLPPRPPWQGSRGALCPRNQARSLVPSAAWDGIGGSVLSRDEKSAKNPINFRSAAAGPQVPWPHPYGFRRFSNSIPWAGIPWCFEASPQTSAPPPGG